MSDDRAALIERLRLDVDRLRTPARLEEPYFRWIGDKFGYRMKSDVATDLEAAIALLEDDTP